MEDVYKSHSKKQQQFDDMERKFAEMKDDMDKANANYSNQNKRTQ